MKTISEINQIIDSLNKNYQQFLPVDLKRASDEELEDLQMAHIMRANLLITLCLSKGAFDELAEIHGGVDELHLAFDVQSEINETMDDLRPAIKVLHLFDWMLKLHRSGKTVYAEVTDDNVYYEWS